MSETLQNELVSVEGITSDGKTGGISKKVSIAVSTIGALVLKDNIDPWLAGIIALIAVAAIICQTILDGKVR